MNDYIPPHNLDAEMALIGSILLDPDLLGEVAAVVRTEDFYSHVHEILFATILELEDQKRPIDKISLVGRLREADKLERIGGPAYLSSLMEAIPSVASAAYYASIIAEKAYLRRLAIATAQGHAMIRQAESEPDSVLADVLEVIEDSAKGHDDRKHRSPEAIALHAAELACNFDRAKRVTSPWGNLDVKTGGCNAGELWVWAGVPKAAKTSALMAVAEHAARNHGTAVYFAIEMGAVAITRRRLARQTGISAIDQKTGNLNGQQKTKLRHAAEQLGMIPLETVDSDIRSIPAIRRMLKRLARQGPLKSVVVDHCGLMQEAIEANGKANKTERLQMVYTRLRALAIEFNCTVHAIQHINRQGAMREDAPTVSDIRDGGNPEGIADLVIIIHRKDPMNLEGKGHEGSFIIAASREGPAGILNMHFDQNSGKWTQVIEEDHLPPPPSRGDKHAWELPIE